MGNYAYLLGNDAGDPNAEVSEPHILAVAKNCIPVFWIGLFELADGCTKRHPCTDSKGTPSSIDAPGFIVSRQEACETLGRRAPHISKFLPPPAQQFLASFAQFIARVPTSHIQFDSAELAFVDEGLEELLPQLVQAYETADTECLSLLFDLASLDFDPSARKLSLDTTLTSEGGVRIEASELSADAKRSLVGSGSSSAFW